MRLDAAPVLSNAWFLRPIEPRDADAWFAYLSVPSVVRHTSWNVRDRDELVGLIAQYDAAAERRTMRFAIVDSSDQLLGTIGFPTMSWVHGTAEVAYDIDPRNAGRGLATCACSAVTEWAFDTLGFVRVQATTLDTNDASARVLRKSGYIVEGVLRNLKKVRGEPRDFRLHAKTRTPS